LLIGYLVDAERKSLQHVATPLVLQAVTAIVDRGRTLLR
jgi:hypothetical protein